MALPVERSPLMGMVVLSWERARAMARRALEEGGPGATSCGAVLLAEGPGARPSCPLGEWEVVRRSRSQELVVSFGADSPRREDWRGRRAEGERGAVSPSQEALLSAMGAELPRASAAVLAGSLTRELRRLEALGMGLEDFERELAEWAVGSVMSS